MFPSAVHSSLIQQTRNMIIFNLMGNYLVKFNHMQLILAPIQSFLRKVDIFFNLTIVLFKLLIFFIFPRFKQQTKIYPRYIPPTRHVSASPLNTCYDDKPSTLPGKSISLWHSLFELQTP